MNTPAPNPTPPSWRDALPRLLLRVGVILALAFGAHWLIDYSMTWAENLPDGEHSQAEDRLLLGIFFFYALLIAIPFVPGIEIALALLMLRGHEYALPLYLATLVGLTLSFIVGRVVPLAALRRLFLDLHLTRAAQLLERLEPLPPPDRVEFLKQSLPKRFARHALNYRYIGLAALVNMPGSGLIGGGGGICLVAGMSGLFTFRATVLTLAIAIAPVPLMIWLAGSNGWMFWIPA